MPSVWLSLSFSARSTVGLYLNREKVEALEETRRTDKYDPLSEEIDELVHDDNFWKARFAFQHRVPINPRALEVIPSWFEVPRDIGIQAGLEMRTAAQYEEFYERQGLYEKFYRDSEEFLGTLAWVQAQIGSPQVVLELLSILDYPGGTLNLCVEKAIKGRNEILLKDLVFLAFFSGDLTFLGVFETLKEKFGGQTRETYEYVKDTLKGPRSEEIFAKARLEETQDFSEYDLKDLALAVNEAGTFEDPELFVKLLENPTVYEKINPAGNERRSYLGAGVYSEKVLEVINESYSHLYTSDKGFWFLLRESKVSEESLFSHIESFHNRSDPRPSVGSTDHILFVMAHEEKNPPRRLEKFYTQYQEELNDYWVLCRNRILSTSRKTLLEAPSFFPIFEKALRHLKENRARDLIISYSFYPSTDPDRYWTALKLLYSHHPEAWRSVLDDKLHLSASFVSNEMGDVYLAFLIKYVLNPQEILVTKSLLDKFLQRAFDRSNKKYYEILSSVAK